MKKLPLIVLVSLCSSLFTVFLIRWLDKPNHSPQRKDASAKYTNFNASPSNVESRVLFSAAPTDFIDAGKLVTPAVVHISARQSKRGYDDFWGRSSTEASSGSGVVISSEGLIVTNNHVIEDGTEFEITFNDRKTFEAELLGTDPNTDLALLKVNVNEELPYLQFADSDSTAVGEWVLAVGNPFNLNSTVTAGIVSAKGRNINILDSDYSIESFIQTDAVVNPGNSGGALVNTRGELVGINTAIITKSGRYEGYSFAVPSNLAQKVVVDLKEFGVVQRAFLGVMITDVTNDIAEEYDLKSLDGVYVSQVNTGSAAQDAGLQEGDIIIEINKTKVKSTPELQEQIARFRPGNKIQVIYLRKGRKKSGELVLKNKSNTTTLINKVESNLQKTLGVELRDLNESEMRKLRTDGIKVISLREGSKLFYTNMEPGFIITKLNDQEVTDLNEFLEILENKKGKIILEGVYEDYSGEYYYTFEK